MFEQVKPNAVQSAAHVLWGALLMDFRNRVENGGPADPMEIRRFISMVKRVGDVIAPDTTRTSVDVERILEVVTKSPSVGAQLHAIHGWEILREPDQALEFLTFVLLNRADLTPAVQHATVDALWRLDGVSPSSADRVMRHLLDIADDPTLELPMRQTAAAALSAVPGSQPALKWLLRGSDNEMRSAVIVAMSDYAELGVERWGSLRSDIEELRHLRPDDAAAREKLVLALQVDGALERVQRAVAAGGRGLREGMQRLTEERIATNPRVPVIAAMVARRALKTGDDTLLERALDVLVKAPDHSRTPRDRQVPTTEALQTFRAVLAHPNKAVSPQQLHTIVSGLRQHGGEEARSILRLAESRPGYQEVMLDVTDRSLGESSVLDNPRSSRRLDDVQSALVNELIHQLRLPVDHHDEKVVALARLAKVAPTLGNMELTRVLTAPDPLPHHQGVTGRTMSEGIADVLTAAGERGQKLMVEALRQATLEPSVRTAVLERVGGRAQGDALALTRSSRVSRELRVAALSSLAEHTLRLDLFANRGGRGNIDGPRRDDPDDGPDLGGPSRSPKGPFGDQGPSSAARRLPAEEVTRQMTDLDADEGEATLPDVTDFTDSLEGAKADLDEESDLLDLARDAEVIMHERTRPDVDGATRGTPGESGLEDLAALSGADSGELQEAEPLRREEVALAAKELPTPRRQGIHL